MPNGNLLQFIFHRLSEIGTGLITLHLGFSYVGGHVLTDAGSMNYAVVIKAYNKSMSRAVLQVYNVQNRQKRKKRETSKKLQELTLIIIN